jgi:hypothetical protein
MALALKNNACEHNKKRNAANHATDQKHSDEFLEVHCLPFPALFKVRFWMTLFAPK